MTAWEAAESPCPPQHYHTDRQCVLSVCQRDGLTLHDLRQAGIILPSQANWGYGVRIGWYSEVLVPRIAQQNTVTDII